MTRTQAAAFVGGVGIGLTVCLAIDSTPALVLWLTGFALITLSYALDKTAGGAS